MADDGLRIELVEPEPDVYNMAYNVVSNATLWFCHHHLFDAARRPRADRRWMEAWDAYRTYNQLFAERVAKVAPEGGRVLVQDYHLALVGSDLARLATRPAHRPLHPHPVRRPVGAADAARPRSGRAARRHGRVRGLRIPHRAVGGGLPGRRAGRSERARPRRPTPTFVSPAVHRCRPPAGLRRPSRPWPARWPASRSGRRARPPGHRAGRPHGAVEEPAAGVLGLRGAARAPSRIAGSGWSSWPSPIPPARACPSTWPTRTRSSPPWPASTSGGRPRVGRRSSSRSRTTIRGRSPRSPATTSCWSTRSATVSTWWPRKGPLINTRNGVLALSREAGAFDELAGRARDQPVRRDRDGGRLSRGPGHGRGRAGRASRRAPGADPWPGSPADWLDDQLAAAR